MSTLVGNQNLLWGITDTAALGFFTDLSYEQDGELTEVTNGDGAIIGAIFSGDKINVTGTFNFDSSQTMPQRGTAITLSQAPEDWTLTTIYLTKITQTFSNANVMQVSFEATSWPDITAP